MKKTPSILAAAVQLLACASLFPNNSSAEADASTDSDATISQRIARVRQAIVEQTKSVSENDGIQLTGWQNWGNGWRNWGNGWRKWGNGWRNWGNGWRKWNNWHNW